MGKVKEKKVYAQNFRPAWLKESELKDWLVEIPGTPAKAHCR